MGGSTHHGDAHLRRPPARRSARNPVWTPGARGSPISADSLTAFLPLSMTTLCVEASEEPDNPFSVERRITLRPRGVHRHRRGIADWPVYEAMPLVLLRR